MPKINEDYCDCCQVCIDNCPAGAMAMVDGKVVIDAEHCLNCGECIDTCPQNAVEKN